MADSDEQSSTDTGEEVERTKTIDRERGILSANDRAYLLGESDIESKTQSERNVRARIRTRITNALLDWYLIDEQLKDRDRQQIATKIDAQTIEGLHGLVAFLLDLADDTNTDLEGWIEGGVMHRHLDEGFIFERPSVTLDIDGPTHIDPEEMEAKLEDGQLDALSEGELRFLLWQIGQHADLIAPIADLPTEALAEYADRIEAASMLDEASMDRQEK
jgi:hypothetical protein